MNAVHPNELQRRIQTQAELLLDADPIQLGTRSDIGPIEGVAVVRHKDTDTRSVTLGDEAADCVFFVWLVENAEMGEKQPLRGEIEVLDVLRDRLAINDEVTFAVENIGNHHDKILFGIGELQGILGDFDIECADHGVWIREEGRVVFTRHSAILLSNVVPLTRSNI